VTTTQATETTQTAHDRIDFQGAVPDYARAMTRLQQASTKEVSDAGIEPLLHELVKIRASQLNGCAYCIDMHTKDARAMGETEQRLYALPAWRETSFYTARERAALAYAESVTLQADTHVPDDVRAAVAAEFSEREVAALITAIVTINSWNRIVVTTRAYEPGSYQP
jgi:AhpD family alkylhydroperoxidase